MSHELQRYTQNIHIIFNQLCKLNFFHLETILKFLILNIYPELNIVLSKKKKRHQTVDIMQQLPNIDFKYE